MPIRSRRRRRRRFRNVRAGLLGGILGAAALLGLAALGVTYALAPAPPTLDKATLCPVAGPRSVTVVVLDNSDPFADATAKEVSTRLTDLAESIPAHGLLEIRILDPEAATGRTAFSACNPGNGSNLSQITGNPEMARRRWLDGFATPVKAALEGSIRGTPSKLSPIMATLQRAALDRFSGRALEGVPKTLVVVSDMVEHGPDYSQYQGEPSFERFRETPAYAKTRADLHGAEVRILLVQRIKGPDPVKLLRFWEAWVKDGNGRLAQADRLQGAM